MNYVIFTDLTSDLTPEECREINIWPEMFMQNITCYGKDVDCTNVEQFYANMDSGSYPAGELKTSTGSPSDLSDILDHIIAQTDPETAIVFATTSPYISPGTDRVAESVMSEYREKYPDRKFIHVNTKCVSGGEATYMHYLARYQGNNIEEYASELSKHIAHLFTIHDLRYAAKSGRFNLWQSIKATIASSLKILPWLYFPYEGQLTSNGRTFRGDKILRGWVDYFIENRAEDANYVRVCYGGSAQLEHVERLVRLLKKNADLADDQIHLTHIGPIIASHTGSTVLALFFKQKNERD